MEKNNWIWIVALGAGIYFWEKYKSQQTGSASASIAPVVPIATNLQSQPPVVATAAPVGQVSQTIAQVQAPVSQIPVAVVSNSLATVSVPLPPVISQQSTINDYGNIVSVWSPNISNQYNV